MSLTENENLSVRIVTADYYLHKPIPEVGDQCYSAFRSLPVYRVPVIRIFGPTTQGVKTCLHVHGVFPYIFIPNWNNEVDEKDLYNFAMCLDKAINASFAYSNSKSSHVHKITQVSGKPFYGYHEGERNFLKIEFYNPAIVKKAADLLLNAAVFNRVFQPHEAHIPYILQFFIDNNLYGMNNISFSSYRVRRSDPQNDLNLSGNVVMADSNIPRLSHSKLEIDITVSDLCNSFSSGDDVPNNPGLAFIWEEEKKHRRFNHKSSQITPNTSQKRPKKPVTRTEKYLRERLDQKLQAIKTNGNVMDFEYDNFSSLSSTCEELNTQSRSLLEILDQLVERRKNENKRTEGAHSGSSSPSLVYSDDENNVADISAISSQPVLKLNAEEDSILGNNFSDEENDLDDRDHKVLSQSIIYSRREHASSDDSDSDLFGIIPQLDGAHGIDSSSKRKSKKGTVTKRGSCKQELKIFKNDAAIEKTYNLRCREKPPDDPKPCETFKPVDFRIVLHRLDAEFSLKKIYPKLNIDTQKPPTSNSSKSIISINDISSNTEKTSSLDTKPEIIPMVESPPISISVASNLSNNAGERDERLSSNFKQEPLDTILENTYASISKVSNLSNNNCRRNEKVSSNSIHKEQAPVLESPSAGISKTCNLNNNVSAKDKKSSSHKKHDLSPCRLEISSDSISKACNLSNSVDKNDKRNRHSKHDVLTPILESPSASISEPSNLSNNVSKSDERDINSKHDLPAPVLDNNYAEISEAPNFANDASKDDQRSPKLKQDILAPKLESNSTSISEMSNLSERTSKNDKRSSRSKHKMPAPITESASVSISETPNLSDNASKNDQRSPKFKHDILAPTLQSASTSIFEMSNLSKKTSKNDKRSSRSKHKMPAPISGSASVSISETSNSSDNSSKNEKRSSKSKHEIPASVLESPSSNISETSDLNYKASKNDRGSSKMKHKMPAPISESASVSISETPNSSDNASKNEKRYSKSKQEMPAPISESASPSISAISNLNNKASKHDRRSSKSKHEIPASVLESPSSNICETSDLNYKVSKNDRRSSKSKHEIPASVLESPSSNISETSDLNYKASRNDRRSSKSKHEMLVSTLESPLLSISEEPNFNNKASKNDKRSFKSKHEMSAPILSSVSASISKTSNLSSKASKNDKRSSELKHEMLAPILENASVSISEMPNSSKNASKNDRRPSKSKHEMHAPTLGSASASISKTSNSSKKTSPNDKRSSKSKHDIPASILGSDSSSISEISNFNNKASKNDKRSSKSKHKMPAPVLGSASSSISETSNLDCKASRNDRRSSKSKHEMPAPILESASSSISETFNLGYKASRNEKRSSKSKHEMPAPILGTASVIISETSDLSDKASKSRIYSSSKYDLPPPILESALDCISEAPTLSNKNNKRSSNRKHELPPPILESAYADISSAPNLINNVSENNKRSLDSKHEMPAPTLKSAFASISKVSSSSNSASKSDEKSPAKHKVPAPISESTSSSISKASSSSNSGSKSHERSSPLKHKVPAPILESASSSISKASSSSKSASKSDEKSPSKHKVPAPISENASSSISKASSSSNSGSKSHERSSPLKHKVAAPILESASSSISKASSSSKSASKSDEKSPSKHKVPAPISENASSSISKASSSSNSGSKSHERSSPSKHKVPAPISENASCSISKASSSSNSASKGHERSSPSKHKVPAPISESASSSISEASNRSKSASKNDKKCLNSKHEVPAPTLESASSSISKNANENDKKLSFNSKSELSTSILENSSASVSKASNLCNNATKNNKRSSSYWKDELPAPILKSPSASISKASNLSNSASKKEKILYPQLDVSIKKSPKSIKPVIAEKAPNKDLSSSRSLKKRKINFDDVDITKPKDTVENSDFISSKWKKSLKRRKRDDTSFKIGESFSLWEFRKSKSNQKLSKKSELDSKHEKANEVASTFDISSQSYNLCVSNTTDILDAPTDRIEGQKSSVVDCNNLSSDSRDLKVLPGSKEDESRIEEISNCDDKIENSNSELHSKSELNSENLILAVPLSDDENEKPVRPKYLSAKFQPIVKLPRITINCNNSSSFMSYETSSIELGVPESQPDAGVESHSSITAPKQSSQTSDLIGSQLIKDSENPLDDSNHDVVSASPKSSQVPPPSLNCTVDEINATKTSQPSIRKKKCLGMRIRKRIQPVRELRSRNSSQSAKNEESVSTTTVQVNSRDDGMKRSGKSSTAPEPYIDSSIDLDITNSEQELFSKRLKITSELQPGLVDEVNLATSQPLEDNRMDIEGSQSCLDNALVNGENVIAGFTCDVTKPVNLATMPEGYENSCVDLDIFNCCGITQDDEMLVVEDPCLKKNGECVDLATPQPSTSGVVCPEIIFSLPLPANEIDPNIAYCVAEGGHVDDVNFATSQSILSEEKKDKTFRWILPSTSNHCMDFLENNILDDFNEDVNVTTSQQSVLKENACSDDSLLCALEALSPESNAALNRRLDSIESQDPATSQCALQDRPSPTTDFLTTPPKTGEKLKTEIVEDFPTDSQLENNDFVLSLEDDGVALLPIPEEPCSPSILDQTKYIIDDCNLSASRGSPERILFEEDSFRMDLSPTQYPEPAKQTKLECLLNDDIWDRSSDVDNDIQSFYHDQTCTPSHITVIQDISGDSSPMARSLSPQSIVSNDILSFYESQSPDAIICSINEELMCCNEIEQKDSPDTKSDPSIVECSQTKPARRSSRRRRSQTAPSVPHSTPSNKSSKKTPSPTYTPVLQKLILKKVGKGGNKWRISSQRFHSEPFLPEIKEEEEKKSEASDKNTTLSLPVVIRCNKSKANKSLNSSRTSTCSGGSYQIDGPTLENAFGFRMNLENLQDVKTDKQYQFVTLLSLEVFSQTRGDLRPDPEFDAISCLFYSVHHDAAGFPRLVSGIIVVDGDSTLTWDINRFKCDKIVVQNEVELFDKFLTVIRTWDPDMFIGYEVEMLSWGYLIQRGCFLGMNYSQQLSRVREFPKPNEPNERPAQEDDEYSNELKLPGRIILNLWRLMRHEVTLQSYTFENILYHVQHQRVPYHSHKFLTECWKDPLKRWIVIDYFLLRAECNLTLLEQLDFVGRTSELARLFGIQFYEVLSRGSQFRVESMMLRLAKTQNYVAVSPSFRQRFNMRAPESLPLIMEPESKFYTDPVIVLDFQSLYPSIIIAYNYCFSTCLGRIDDLGQTEPFHFGCIEHTVPPDLLIKLESSLNLSPAGVAFVNETIRKGILPSMLEEILETRLMVKKSMKENKDNSTLKRVLHARQLGLKLIANVTYGYTSANFSGRMPCIEIADSVVSKGRETLERAIDLVNNTTKWGARVVYGDTDSLFVLVPNKTKEEAFRIGAEIADAVTKENPKPVKLKLEKVYLPCMLQTKKRYVGYMYESVDQKKPVYDAKGIETVRRDGCPAVSKILEKSLKILFDTRNVNTVKQYVQRQFTKLIAGRISIQELTFAREYRGMRNYKPAACVPALQIAKQALLKDRRAEPRIKERVRYVITSGPPGVPLIRLVRTPEEFLDSPGSLINTEYYITRAIIPALERCFILMNVNILPWYTELPKKQRMNLPISYEMKNKNFKKTTISHYFSSSRCLSCSKVGGSVICQQCQHRPQRVALILGNMINEWQRKRNSVEKICRSCCGRSGKIGCSSLDCPIYYVLRQSAHEAEQVQYVEDLRRQYLFF